MFDQRVGPVGLVGFAGEGKTTFWNEISEEKIYFSNVDIKLVFFI